MAFGLEDYIVNPYLRALAVIVAVFVVLRLFVFVLQKIILKATSKTKTKMDDMLIAKASKPITYLIVLLGFRIAVEELALTEGIELVVNRVLISLVVVFVSYLVYLVIDIILFNALKHVVKSHYDAVKDLVSLVKSVLRVVLVVLAVLYILSIWGVEIGPFLAGLGIAGIAVAFALQSTLSNVFSGASILLDKSLRVGDVVYLDANTRGKVSHIGLRATRIKTFDNELIIVPNSKVAESNIQNIVLPEPKSRVVVPFGVAYGSDVEKVKKIVLSEIRKVKNFVNDPEPSVKFLEMSDSALNFKAFFYVDSFEHRFGALDEANTRIYNALNKNRIEIPFPQMDVHVKRK